ncbi:hypothetical protein GEOBRER4_n0268 [Citrifermentans bremense]|uniref:Uncharacterized protein n=1 Tax=Citrifermentans bremense TaxID=60035 RepID=A0A6S6M191_9BACT|nr:hypothetical protein [Citrifermentans bremense]BCG45511.1 hypothetical protein GEOBRER4_n0268 [Citrifermentans bremense]
MTDFIEDLFAVLMVTQEEKTCNVCGRTFLKDIADTQTEDVCPDCQEAENQ